MKTTQFTPIIQMRNIPTIPEVKTTQYQVLPVITPLGTGKLPQENYPAVAIPAVPLPNVTPFPGNIPTQRTSPNVTPFPGNIPIQRTLPNVTPFPGNIPTQRKSPNVTPFPGNIPTQRTLPNVIPFTGNVSEITNAMRNVTLNVRPRVPATNIMNMVPIPNQVQELVLRPWQIEWANRAHNILLRNHGYIDTSRMGSGKTYVTLWLAKQFGFRIIIVCPVIMIDVWRRTAAEYGVEVLDIISYQSLRSQKNHQPKHGYLDRFDNITEGGTRQVSFAASRSYTELVNQGVMVIFDEIQNIKNNSDQYKACSALIRPILTTGGRSRFGLLSGTPFDKEEHAVNLLRLIGYIRAHRLYNYVRETKEIVLEGMQELIDACHFIDTTETDRVLADIPAVKSKMNTLCYSLYTRVIKANISGAMPAPTTINGRFDVKNGFYTMTGERGQQLQDAIDELATAVRFNERTGAAEMRADNIGAVTTALVHIENSKVDDFARVATQILDRDVRNKVIICVNYTSSITEIANLLIFYNPLILTGKIPAAKRGIIVRMFNNSERRVLLMNTAVGGVGISLHDTTGNSPRFMLMSPSYKLIELAQGAGRIYRDGTQSDATIRMFYGKGNAGRETGILTAMSRKTQVLRGTLDDNVARDLVLPGDYEAETELDA